MHKLIGIGALFLAAVCATVLFIQWPAGVSSDSGVPAPVGSRVAGTPEKHTGDSERTELTDEHEVSTDVSSHPLVPEEAPQDWLDRYLAMSPSELREELVAVEVQFGKARTAAGRQLHASGSPAHVPVEEMLEDSIYYMSARNGENINIELYHSQFSELYDLRDQYLWLHEASGRRAEQEEVAQAARD